MYCYWTAQKLDYYSYMHTRTQIQTYIRYIHPDLIKLFSTVNLYLTNGYTEFRHESRGGYYYVSAYFISQVLCDIIPQRLLPVIPFFIISYFLIGKQYNQTLHQYIYSLTDFLHVGLKATASQYFYAMLILMLTSCCGAGTVYLASSVFDTMEKAHLVLSLIFLLMTVKLLSCL